MIDVQIQPFGRSLMTMALGALKYQAVVKQKNIDNFKKEIQNIKNIKKDTEMWSDLSQDITSRMLDKRFTESKMYIKSSGRMGSLKFKKSTSESDKRLQYITEKNMLKTRTKLNNAVSQHNQSITDLKIKTSFKRIEVNQVL